MEKQHEIFEQIMAREEKRSGQVKISLFLQTIGLTLGALCLKFILNQQEASLFFFVLSFILSAFIPFSPFKESKRVKIAKRLLKEQKLISWEVFHKELGEEFI